MPKIGNEELKVYARSKRVAVWRIADVVGLSEQQMYRKLRRDLPKEEQEKLKAIIDRLAD